MGNFVNVFEFTRFRRFLATYQEQRYLVDDSFTRTEFCKHLKLPNTRSYFSDVVRGKRVTKLMLDRFLQVLNLNPNESKYFRAMVAFDQARSPISRERAFAEMQALHPNPITLLEPDAFEYYSNWYHSAVFAILDVLDVDDDYKGLEKKISPAISRDALKESFELLSRLKLIQKNDLGFWKPSRDRISTGADSKDIFIKQYQIQCLELCKQALEANSISPQQSSAMIFSVSHDAKQKIEKAMEIFRTEVYKAVAEDTNNSTQVLNLSVNLVTLLKKEES